MLSSPLCVAKSLDLGSCTFRGDDGSAALCSYGAPSVVGGTAAFDNICVQLFDPSLSRLPSGSVVQLALLLCAATVLSSGTAAFEHVSCAALRFFLEPPSRRHCCAALRLVLEPPSRNMPVVASDLLSQTLT